jgi:hypothetical protein
MHRNEAKTPHARSKSVDVHPRRRRAHKAVGGLALLTAAYLGIAYAILPLAWEAFSRRHPSLDDNPRITLAGDGHPGDPLNVALFGSLESMASAMQAAGWRPAAHLGLRSDLEIAGDTLLSRPDVNAPVSSLYLFGRREDLAYEQPVGDNPRQRHHVRFWRAPQEDEAGRPLWIGAASYDARVGLSHTTGEVTHHIAPDVDAERDHLFVDLRQGHALAEEFVVDGFHRQLEGRNGGGDPWRTDGRLFVGMLRGQPAPNAATQAESQGK